MPDLATGPAASHRHSRSRLGSTAGRDGSRGEHPDRSPNPVIKVTDLAWLEFVKPDLDRAEIFAADFGFSVAARTRDTLYLRGTEPGPPCLLIHRGRGSRFIGPAFRAAGRCDLERLARAADGGPRIRALRAEVGGHVVDLRDPSGFPVRVVHGWEELSALPGQPPFPVNVGGTPAARINAAQRPAREPARIQRLGHVVLQTRHFSRALEWYQHLLGLIVSDFLFLAGQYRRGPVMAFLRCDRGSTPTDHHTLAVHLGPENSYGHSAYQVTDLDALAAGGEYLAERGWTRSWGIGRHIQGSQIFDYWRDPDRMLVEHFTDGDLFNSDAEPGWAPMSADGLAQWGPAATRDFLGTPPSPATIRKAVAAVLGDGELDLARLMSLLKAMNS